MSGPPIIVCLDEAINTTGQESIKRNSVIGPYLVKNNSTNNKTLTKLLIKKRWKTLIALECKSSTVTSNPAGVRTKWEKVTKITIK